MSESSTAAAGTTRAYASFVPTWQRFNISDGASPAAGAGTSGISPRSVTDAANSAANSAANANPYLRQYSHVYSRRLAALRGRCLANANTTSTSTSTTTAKAKLVSRILELEEAQPSTIVGTVAKEMTASRRPAVDTGYHSSAITSVGYLGTISPQDLHLDPLGTYCAPQATAAGSGANANSKGKGSSDDDVDRLYLEDESGRVELVDDGSGVLDVQGLATGVIMAVTGSVREGTGIMVVSAVHMPTLPDKAAAAADTEAEAQAQAEMKGPGSDPGGDPYLLLISGLGCGASSNHANAAAGGDDGDGGGGSLDLRRDMVLDYLAGHSDATRDGARVARVIVAGGGCAGPAALAEIAAATRANGGATFGASAAAAANTGKAAKAGAAGTATTFASPNDPSLPIKELDLFLSELCASGIPVDYLPGRHDPTTAVWPQRPVHPCLLPRSATYERMLRRAPNPYEATVGGRVVLGTDGRNVADLRRYMAATSTPTTNGDGSSGSGDNQRMDVDGAAGEQDGDADEKKEEEEQRQQPIDPPSALDTLEATLRFAHVAPTGPDSLPTYPAFEDDPFVMDVRPDLYFAGNCAEYETKVTAHGTRLVCVPSFDATGKAVLVNLRTLDCEVIGFADA